MNNLNNYSIIYTANVLDSASYAYHKLCSYGISDFDLGCPLRKAISSDESTPESWTLDPSIDFNGVIGGFFF